MDYLLKFVFSGSHVQRKVAWKNIGMRMRDEEIRTRLKSYTVDHGYENGELTYDYDGNDPYVMSKHGYDFKSNCASN